MIEHSQPYLGNEEKKAVLNVLRSNYIAEGEQVKAFEKEVAQYIGALGGVATSTGTLALHLALLALDIRKNDEIIIPSYTCRSVLNGVLYSGAKPVLVDVSCDNYNILFREAKKRITRRTKVIIVPHMFGCPAEIEKFKKMRVYIIEDCAHSIGAIYKRKKVGSWGHLSLFSFEGTKYIVTGEGGMVLANSARLLERIRQLKERDSFDFPIKYTYRMTDLQAAIGREQLKKIESFIHRRRTVAEMYNKFFSQFDVKLPLDCLEGRHIYQRYMMQVKCNINRLMKNCFAKGIKVKQPVKPCALHRYVGLSKREFPNSEYIMNSAVSIPIYPSLTTKQISYIGAVISEELEKSVS